MLVTILLYAALIVAALLLLGSLVTWLIERSPYQQQFAQGRVPAPLPQGFCLGVAHVLWDKQTLWLGKYFVAEKVSVADVDPETYKVRRRRAFDLRPGGGFAAGAALFSLLRFYAMHYLERAFRVGVAGPVGSGKTALVDALSKQLHCQPFR